MKLDRFKSRAVLFLIAFAFSFGTEFPQDIRAEASAAGAGLRFGQTIALSDFDSDGVVDEAIVDGAGLHSRVGILLSGSGTRVSLHFRERWINHGSLFARDLDDDGLADLVWTDLLHDESVVVWLGDGSGTFKQCSAQFTNEFALGDETVTAPADSNLETAANFDNDDRTFTLPLNGKFLERGASGPRARNSETTAVSSPFIDQPADRGPPLPLN
ncbi:MAG TPA: hypothetical protein VLM38_24235 [Blastocatellia bacterium]|nr:hypothetical protein [Blastocatellia bacterium]